MEQGRENHRLKATLGQGPRSPDSQFSGVAQTSEREGNSWEDKSAAQYLVCGVNTTLDYHSSVCAPFAGTRRMLCGTGDIAHPGRLPLPCPRGLLFLPRLLLFAFHLRRADACLPLTMRLLHPTSCTHQLSIQPQSHLESRTG